MKQLLSALSLLAMLFVLSGCGETEGDRQVKEYVKSLNEFADGLEAGRYDSKDLKKHTRKSAEKLNALNLPDDEKNRLAKKYHKEIEQVNQRIKQVMLKKLKEKVGKSTKM